jgi:hypothetical protein
MHHRHITCSVLAFFLVSCGDEATQANLAEDAPGLRFLESKLLPPPVSPADLGSLDIQCPLETRPASARYRSAADVDYSRPGWETRIASDWKFFDAPADEGWLTVIDFRRQKDGLAYRYLANDGSHNRLYEPWSSSKIQAFTAAVSVLRRHGIGADALAGGTPLSDLITSINSYAPSGAAGGDSNAIASFFLNVAGRDYATALFHEAWLDIENDEVRFRGAYGPTAFTPSSYEFASRDEEVRATPPVYRASTDDPGYLDYRCDACGTDGNKAMTALAQTEWLKRLASHSREAATRHPDLETSDVETLFFGGHERGREAVGGMLAGISVFLPEALARTLAPDSADEAGRTLDALTDGRWRVYQKVGWGPSETRGTSELVILAHVCLPNVGGTGREFTLFGRASVPGANPDESGVGEAGIKLSRLLDRSLPQFLGKL